MAFLVDKIVVDVAPLLVSLLEGLPVSLEVTIDKEHPHPSQIKADRNSALVAKLLVKAKWQRVTADVLHIGNVLALNEDGEVQGHHGASMH